MDDNSVLFIFKLLFLGFIIWLFFFRRKDEPRNTISVQPKGSNPEHQNLLVERDSKILTKPPYVVRQAMDAFFREHRGASSSSTIFGVEESPLTCFGYRVGKTNGRPDHQRKDILKFAVWGEIPNFFPDYYRNTWGKPGTYKRYRKIIDHISMLADQRAGRLNFEVAVSQWLMDINWLNESYGILMDKIRLIEI